MTKFFLPSDRPDADVLKLWRQHAVSVASAKMLGIRPEDVAKHYWGSDPGLYEALMKAAIAPASSNGWGGQLASGKVVAAFLASLASASAAARLFAACARVDLTGQNVAVLPGLGKVIRDPAFVAEGQPIPAVTGNFAGATLGPQRKLAAITGISGDLAQYSAENALDVIEMAMRDAAASALDAALFSDAAGSDARPAGLLAGVSPIAAASGGPADAMVADLAGLAGAISAAGGGTGILYFANPRQEVAVRLRSAAFADVIVPTPRLAPGTVVAVETNAIASAFDGLPQVDVATATAIHWEDTNPAQISTAGSPNAVAAPVTSIFQTAGYALRLILRCAWASRMPGAVQMVTGAAW